MKRAAVAAMSKKTKVASRAVRLPSPKLEQRCTFQDEMPRIDNGWLINQVAAGSELGGASAFPNLESVSN